MMYISRMPQWIESHPKQEMVLLATFLMLALLPLQANSFAMVTPMTAPVKLNSPLPTVRRHLSLLPLKLSESPKEGDIRFARSTELDQEGISLDELGDAGNTEQEGKAATNTVNERLLAELEEAKYKEKFGSRSGRKMGVVDGFGRPRKTDAEIQASIEAARDLNGVNPVIAVVGSLFALGTAAGLWYATQQLGTFFLLHPVDTDVYFVIRATQVVRNIAMGLVSLASGFFGVTGLGILGMGIRVAYGVATGELDPTPIKQNKAEEVKMPNVWDLMMGKKPGRRGGGGSNDDNNPFGI